MKSTSILSTVALSSTLVFAPLALAQDAPGAPMGEAKPPSVGVAPPGSTERQVGSGKPQARGAEDAPGAVTGEAAEAAKQGLPEPGEMAKPPVPDPLLSDEEEDAE